jgi:alanyl-tRNA synthetase
LLTTPMLCVELLTKDFGLNKDKLLVTVYHTG